MISTFEYEDEKGILHSNPPDNPTNIILQIFKARNIFPDAFYVTRRAEGFVYDGTVHKDKEIIYFLMLDNNLYWLADSQRRGYKRGKPLDQCPHAQVFSLRNYI
jgi:hypothetical protein